MEQIEELTGQALYRDQLVGSSQSGNYEKGSYMVTYNGVEFYPLDPNPDDILIEDIAQALSNNCRFCGHVKIHYSVAQHSVIVSQLCDPENALAGLLHDASEAYLSDITRPVKYTQKMEGYREIEHNLERVIAQKFGLPFPMTKDIKRADDMALMSEGCVLFKSVPGWVKRRLADAGLTEPPVKIYPVPAPVAKGLFLKRFYELQGYRVEATQEEINAATQEN